MSLRRTGKKKSSLATPYSHSQLSLGQRPPRTSLPPSEQPHPHHLRRASTPLYETSYTQPDSSFPDRGGSSETAVNRWPSSGLGRSREQLYTSQGHLRPADSSGHLSRQPSATLYETHMEHTLTQPEPHTLTQPEPHTLTQPSDLGALVTTASPRSKLGGAVKTSQFNSAYSSGMESAEVHPVDWEILGGMGQHRQRAVNNLLTNQLSVTEELRSGVDTYIDPLVSLLPSEIHNRMFIGLKQLCAISMAITSQLKARCIPYTSDSSLPVTSYVENIADIYWTHLAELLDCLKVTLGNSAAARQEISTSFATFEAFSRLAEESVVRDKKHSIYSFVECVNDYLPKLARSMFALVYFTPLQHEDQRYLASITEDLMGLCRDKELVSHWERQTDAMKRLQLCVAFGGKVKQFRLSTPGRLLVHEGEVILVERRRKRKVWVLVLSDLLLVTRKQGKILMIIEEPLLLDNVMVQDFHCSDANEIQVSTANGSWSRIFRTPNESDKELWMSKIKERASGSLSNRRKQGDKSRSTLQPHVADALRKQSQQIQASAVATEMTDGKGPEEGPEEGLKRGSSKRRSLFGSKKDKFSPERNSRLKRSFRGRPATPKKLTLADVGVETLKRWKMSFDIMIQCQEGLLLFEEFLKSEFSEENIQFWKACERFKTVPMETLPIEAKAINDEYILQRAPKWVNLDHQTTQEIAERLTRPDQSMFLKAQHQVFILMQRDSFKRFLVSEPFQSALNR